MRKPYVRHKPFPASCACAKCQEMFPREVFLNSKGKKSKQMCPSCYRAHYLENKEGKDRTLLDREPALPSSTFRSKLISDLGGKCQRCGYEEFTTSLHFHHMEPSEKEGNVSVLITNYCNIPTEQKLVKLQAEIAKCVLLCANCHNSLHAKLWSF